MEYLYAVMLLYETGKKINEKNITKVLIVAGFKVNLARVKVLVDSLSNIDIEEIIKSIPPMKAPEPIVEEEKTVEEKPKEEEKEELGLGKLFD